ncbi:hypothetical protein SSPO_083710 [Streptomyces antimycoticus]|uniref:Sugar ABC transporter permease n=1 Tax=Streptomyces antimycoticus TaxID=68175 RepID=A0A499UUE8_9ACTN|nr:sugar ABC transporter permease [Streptomyces antimycoticus]BBJ45653.1 hypothetical protein SSPO_083710 [Streptomyces antimycoticus]
MTALGTSSSASTPRTVGAAARPSHRRGTPGSRGREALTDYLFIAPAVVLFAVMGLYTVGYGFLLGFARWNGFAPRWDWVGLDNYADLLWRDPVYAPRVHEAARHTLYVMIAVPVLTVAVSFPLAVALARVKRAQAVLRSVYFLPYVMLDGAGWWRTQVSVVWPLLRPITAIVVLLTLRSALHGFQTFLIMTNGGPGTHTDVLGLEAYRLAFLSKFAPTLGLAGALGWMLFAVAIVLALINLRALRSRV